MKLLPLLCLVCAPLGPALAQGTCEVTTRLVSTTDQGGPVNEQVSFPSISLDGSQIGFVSGSSDLVSGDTNGAADLFLLDLMTGGLEIVSTDSSGAQHNGTWAGGDISGNGRLIAFTSDATNLVPGDTNDRRDVFVKDLTTGAVERVSVSSQGVQGSHHSALASISEDGRIIAFTSLADNLVPGDANGSEDVFIHDRLAGTTERVSVTSSGAELVGDSWGAELALNGQLVFFESNARLVPSLPTGDKQIYGHDRVTGVTEMVSVSDAGQPSNRRSELASASADGRYVAFRSQGVNLDSDAPALWNRKVFVRDRLAGRTTCEGRSIHEFSSGTVSHLRMSPDGSVLGFSSTFPQVGVSSIRQSFARSRDLGHICTLSTSAGGELGNYHSEHLRFDETGSRVAYQSRANNLAPGDTDLYTADVFAADFGLGVGEVICGGDGRFGDCPCANVGTRGEGCENSTRRGARLDVEGSEALSIDDLAFHGRNLPPGELVLLFAGRPGLVQTFGDGLMCLSGPLTRVASDDANPQGRVTWGSGMLSAADAPYGVAIAFQAWYRDPNGPCGSGANLTHAVRILPSL